MKERFIDIVLRFPGRLLLLFTGLVILLGIGLKNLSITNNFRVYFSEDNPQLVAFENFEATFTPSDNTSLVVEAKQGDLFTPSGLELIEKLTNESWQIPFSKRVSSIQNFQHVTAEGDDIIIRNLFEGVSEPSDTEIADIKSIALNKNQLVHRLISPDGMLTVILTVINLNRGAGNDSLEVARFVRALRDRYQTQYPDFIIHVGGSTTMNASLAEGVGVDMATLVPLSYVTIFCCLLLFLRSLTGTLSIFLMVTACLMGTFGFFGLVAPKLTPVSSFVPSILLSIMVADSVHILTSFFHAYRSGLEKAEAIKESLQINFLPVTITSATTFIGFLCLNFSDSPPYRALGNMVASGVVLAWIFSLTVLPALVYFLPMSKKRGPGKSDQFFKWLASTVILRRKSLFIGLTLVMIVFTSFIPANRLSDNWVEYFDESFEIRRLVDKIEGKIAGVGLLEFVLTSKVEAGINNPDYLTQVEAFSNWVLQQKYVVHANCYVNILKDLNQSMHGDDPAWHRLPDSQPLAAQYLLLYESSLPLGLGTDDMIDISKTSTRMTVGTSIIGTENVLVLDRLAHDWLKENAAAIKAAPATGMSMVFAHMNDRNLISLLKGTAIALLLISLLLIVVLRSWRYGLISLAPNLMPAAIAYGFWGMTVGRIDMALAVVACATLGIIVDDTVHFLYKYVYARRTLNQSAPEAIHYSFKTVGFALFVTSAVLGAGFTILGFSHMYTTVNVGLMMCLTIVVALVMDFFFLPPLLLKVDRATNNDPGMVRDKEVVV